MKIYSRLFKDSNESNSYIFIPKGILSFRIEYLNDPWKAVVSTKRDFITKDFEVFESYKLGPSIKEKIGKVIKPGKIVKYYDNRDKYHQRAIIVSFDFCHYATEDEILAFYNEMEVNSLIGKKMRKHKLEINRSDSLNESSPKKVQELKGPPNIKQERVSPSEIKSSPDYLGDYDYEEELRNIKLEKIEHEMGIERHISKLRIMLNNVVKKLRTTIGNDPEKVEEIASLKDMAGKIVNILNIQLGRLKKMKERSGNWYDRAKSDIVFSKVD